MGKNGESGSSHRGDREGTIAEPTAEAYRVRHPGFPSFGVIAGGPGSLTERSATGAGTAEMVI
jgi:hypothetical protein